MIITIEPGADLQALREMVEKLLGMYQGISLRTYDFQGSAEKVTELHLVGDTRQLPVELFSSLEGVRSVVRVLVKYRIIGRPPAPARVTVGFEYNGVRFDESCVNLFAGPCAVETRAQIEEMLRALAAGGVTTTRMGAYKPRTSPYDFQGLGQACLPWVLELAGKYGIRVIAMEVCDAHQIEEITRALEEAGSPTGIMLQVGARNAQNFELLKQIGQQTKFPVLFKRGMGLTLEESLNACEYIASEGNSRIVFALRGVKSHLSEPHRNLVDFSHVPVVRRLTRLPVCIDPSHSVGNRQLAPDGLPDIFHAVGQGIISGASMVLVEFHPDPTQARCDGHQALSLLQLPQLQRYIERVRRAYEEISGAAQPASA